MNEQERKIPKNLLGKFEVEASEAELEEEVSRRIIDEKVPKFIIKRRQSSFMDKMKTPLWRLEDAFITEQESRRNSPYTIKHYQQTFRVFYEFLAFEYCEDADDIDKMYDKYPDEKNPLALYGKMFPIAILENDELQKEFGDYLERERECGEQTILSYYRDFRAFMYFAMEKKLIQPFAISVSDTEPAIKNPYTTEEIRRLLKKPDIDNFEEYRNWVIVNYFLSTGNRLQTVKNLKVGDIDFEDGFININVQKSGKTMRLGLTKKLSKVLQEYIYYYRTDEDTEQPLYDEPLFCTRKGLKFTDNGFKNTMRNYHLSRGVHKTSLHLYRHTYAKLWITSGGDLISLQKTLGHSSLKMVQRYANLYATDVRDKMEEHAALNQQAIAKEKPVQRRGKSIKKRVK